MTAKPTCPVCTEPVDKASAVLVSVPVEATVHHDCHRAFLHGETPATATSLEAP